MKRIVALEVSPDTIRAAEIASPFSKEPKLIKVGEIPLSENVAGESIILHQRHFISALKELWSKERFKTKNVGLVVSGREFLVHRHVTKYDSLKALKPMLQYDAAGVLQDSMTDPVLDFYPTAVVSTANDVQETGGLVVAAQSSRIEVIVSAISDAGFYIEYVDYAPMAVARFIRNHVNPTGDYILANVRENTTDILVTKNGIAANVRVVARGLDPERQLAVASEDDDDKEPAEEEFIFETNFEVKEEDPMDSLAKDIRQTAENVAISSPEILYLTGNRSYGTELARTLEEILGIEVEILFPKALDLVKEKKKNPEPIDNEVLASSFVAVCAGMRGK